MAGQADSFQEYLWFVQDGYTHSNTFTSKLFTIELKTDLLISCFLLSLIVYRLLDLNNMTDEPQRRRGSISSTREAGAAKSKASTAKKEDPTTVIRPSPYDRYESSRFTMALSTTCETGLNSCRFPVSKAKSAMREILHDKLEGETFSPDLAKPIADEIRSQVRGK